MRSTMRFKVRSWHLLKFFHNLRHKKIDKLLHNHLDKLGQFFQVSTKQPLCFEPSSTAQRAALRRTEVTTV